MPGILCASSLTNISQNAFHSVVLELSSKVGRGEIPFRADQAGNNPCNMRSSLETLNMRKSFILRGHPHHGRARQNISISGAPNPGAHHVGSRSEDVDDQAVVREVCTGIGDVGSAHSDCCLNAGGGGKNCVCVVIPCGDLQGL